jgi:hypothetical protein
MAVSWGVVPQHTYWTRSNRALRQQSSSILFLHQPVRWATILVRIGPDADQLQTVLLLSKSKNYRWLDGCGQTSLGP